MISFTYIEFFSCFIHFFKFLYNCISVSETAYIGKRNFKIYLFLVIFLLEAWKLFYLGFLFYLTISEIIAFARFYWQETMCFLALDLTGLGLQLSE